MTFVEWTFFVVGVWVSAGVLVCCLVVALQEMSLRVSRRAAR